MKKILILKPDFRFPQEPLDKSCRPWLKKS